MLALLVAPLTTGVFTLSCCGNEVETRICCKHKQENLRFLLVAALQAAADIAETAAAAAKASLEQTMEKKKNTGVSAGFGACS